MSYRRSGPSPLLVVIVVALLVFGGYYVWTGFLRFLEDQGDIAAQVTRAAVSTSTAQFSTQPATRFAPSTPTSPPPCQPFIVIVERAVYRSCPSQNNDECPRVDTLPYGAQVCVYERSPENAEWYTVDLNPEGMFRDIVYMHETVIEALEPTPRPTLTFTPPPTVTPLPTPTPTPTEEMPPTDTPDPATPPTSTPTRTPTATPRQIII